MAVDRDDADGRTGTTEHHSPLRRTWIIGWHEAGQLVLAYLAMTAVFALVGWVAFADNRRWWLVDLDERISRWFVDQRTDPLNTATLIGSWLSETVTKIAVTAIVVLILLRWLRRWYEALVVAVTLILEAMVFITTTFIVGRSRPAGAAPRWLAGRVELPIRSRGGRRLLRRDRDRGRQQLRTTVGRRRVVDPRHRCADHRRPASRMYRGMHFMSDVVAGMILGAVSVGSRC